MRVIREREKKATKNLEASERRENKKKKDKAFVKEKEEKGTQRVLIFTCVYSFSINDTHFKRSDS